MPDIDERSLIERCRRGDDSAFAVLVDAYKDQVYGLIYRMIYDRTQVDDLAQEVFLKVHRGLPYFRGEAKLSTWIFQIAWNYLRGHRRRVGRHLATVAEGSEEVVGRTPDPTPGPERRAVAADLLDRVSVAMDELPEHYRVVVWLRDGEDLSYAEIADVLDLPVGTVRSRLARARAALKKAVGL